MSHRHLRTGSALAMAAGAALVVTSAVSGPALAASSTLETMDEDIRTTAEAEGVSRVPVFRDDDGGVLPPGLSRHVDTFCGGSGSDGPRVTAMYVREAGDPDRYAASRTKILEELKFIDDVFAVSAAQTGGGRRVRWEVSSGCTPVVENVTVPDGSLRSFDATVRALEGLGYDRGDRKYLAFADSPLGTLSGGACGTASKFADDSPTGNDNDGGTAQHARVDLDCWSVSPDTYVSAALHELLHTLGALQDSAPHASGRGHCTDAADVMCYDDSAAGGKKPTLVCPTADRWQIDCNKDDYFHTDPPAGSYLATHWNIASSSFLATVPPLLAPPVGTAWSATRRTLAGEIAMVRATAPAGATVRWQFDDARCDDVKASGRGLVFTVRCFEPAEVDVIGTVVDEGVTASHMTVPVVFSATGAPRVNVSAPVAAGAGSTFSIFGELLKGRSATWSLDFYATHPACSIRKAAASARVTCGSAAEGARVPVGVIAKRAEDGVTRDRSTSVQIVAAGTPTVGIMGPPDVPVGDAGSFRAYVEGAKVASYAWSSSKGYGGRSDRASYVVSPPASAPRGSDTLGLTLTFTDGTGLTLSRPYSIVPDLSVRLTGPARLSDGAAGVFRASVNRSAEAEWTTYHPDCAMTPSADGRTAELRCPEGTTGEAVVSVTAAAGDEVDGDRRTVTLGAAPQTAKEATSTVLKSFRRGFKAVVRSASGPVPGASVDLRMRTGGKRWSKAASAKTSSRGVAVFRMKKNRRAVYVAVTRGGAAYAGSKSAIVRGR